MTEETSRAPAGQPHDAAAQGRQLLRCALKGALATLDQGTGHPYASLVAIATEPDGTPVLLLSRLALHTQNLAADSRASLLIDGSDPVGNPLAGGRVTLIGRAETARSDTARRRYLARHPEAEGYSGFADFAFYTLHVERGHFIGGFGRILALTAEDLLIPGAKTQRLIAAEPELLATLNRDSAEGIARLGADLSGGRTGDWRIVGVDPGGFDLVLGSHACRCDFPDVVDDPELARRAIETRLPAG